MIDRQAAHFITDNRSQSLLVMVIVLCSASLLAIWTLPGTIALRHLLLITGAITSLIYLAPLRVTLLIKRSAWPLWLFTCFYGWLLIHLLFISHDAVLQFAELKSLWLRALLAIPIGLALGIIISQQYPQTTSAPTPTKAPEFITISLFIGLLGTSLISACRYLYAVFQSHQVLHYDLLYSLYQAKQPFVIANALLLPLCFILVFRATQSSESKQWIAPSVIGICLSLFSSYFSNTKNGIVVFGTVFIFFILKLLLNSKISARNCFLGIFIFIVLASVSYFGISKHLDRNPQWFSIIADAKVGVDIDHQNRWKNSVPYPLNEFGKTVDGSTYERSAWLVAGSHLLLENPLGYGLLHHSFGLLASAKWPDYQYTSKTSRGATHSGWLDFALGLGLPGLFLVLIPLWTSWYRSLYQEGLWFSYAGWTIPILSLAFLTTEVAVGHFIEMLFFMIAFFCGLTLQYPANFRHHIKESLLTPY